MWYDIRGGFVVDSLLIETTAWFPSAQYFKVIKWKLFGRRRHGISPGAVTNNSSLRKLIIHLFYFFSREIALITNCDRTLLFASFQNAISQLAFRNFRSIFFLNVATNVKWKTTDSSGYIWHSLSVYIQWNDK